MGSTQQLLRLLIYLIFSRTAKLIVFSSEGQCNLVNSVQDSDSKRGMPTPFDERMPTPFDEKMPTPFDGIGIPGSSQNLVVLKNVGFFPAISLPSR